VTSAGLRHRVQMIAVLRSNAWATSPGPGSPCRSVAPASSRRRPATTSHSHRTACRRLFSGTSGRRTSAEHVPTQTVPQAGSRVARRSHRRSSPAARSSTATSSPLREHHEPRVRASSPRSTGSPPRAGRGRTRAGSARDARRPGGCRVDHRDRHERARPSIPQRLRARVWRSRSAKRRRTFREADGTRSTREPSSHWPVARRCAAATSIPLQIPLVPQHGEVSRKETSEANTAHKDSIHRTSTLLSSVVFTPPPVLWGRCSRRRAVTGRYRSPSRALHPPSGPTHPPRL
jgi:hypothetical protein